MLVSNQYGRSSTNTGLYRMSGFGDIYTVETYPSMRTFYLYDYRFDFYLAITDISSESGSMEGGTILTINGDYFRESSEYPLTVNVGDDSCAILSSKQNVIQCLTSTTSANNRNHYHGKSISMCI